MARSVYLVKRHLKARKKNGQREYKWVVRWVENGKYRGECTGTADRTQADELRKKKWAELNLGGPPTMPAPPPEPEQAGPTWEECSEALKRAMKANNNRPTYVSEAIFLLGFLGRMFPELASPADVTPRHANQFIQKRCEGEGEPGSARPSPWTVKSDLASIKAIFGKWLAKKCGLLKRDANPFADIDPPRCDEPDVRIVTDAEQVDLCTWLSLEWNDWRLPLVFLDVSLSLGWRVTEVASIREEDLLDNCEVRAAAASSKTRKNKFGQLRQELYDELKACCAGGYAFGKFSGDLQRLLMLWKRKPNHAAKVKEFTPARLVAWMQDQLKKYNDEKAKDLATWSRFTLHDFRRTAITGLQELGADQKSVGTMVGCSSTTMARHYEALNRRKIAERMQKLQEQKPRTFTRPLRATENLPLDDQGETTQTGTA